MGVFSIYDKSCVYLEQLLFYYYKSSTERKLLALENLKAVFFDMDGTLIEEETIDELARLAGCYDVVSDVTERAMQGEIDFEQALRERVALLKGQPSSIYNAVFENFNLREGLEEFCGELKDRGCKLFLVSGGFYETAFLLKERLGFDGVHANQIGQDQNGFLTGELIGEIVDGASKASFVQKVVKSQKLEANQYWIFGDGANDIEMFKKAEFTIGVSPKKALEPYCSLILSEGSYKDLLNKVDF